MPDSETEFARALLQTRDVIRKIADDADAARGKRTSRKHVDFLAKAAERIDRYVAALVKIPEALGWTGPKSPHIALSFGRP
jgi:hypothetical protein